MQISPTCFDGLHIIQPSTAKDERGEFSRIFCRHELSDLLRGQSICQVNTSRTKHSGTIRGLHYQVAPFEEIKIIFCTEGRIYDVVVDMRPQSKTFKKWHACELAQGDSKMLLIPPGFAHGFQALEDNTAIQYFVTQFYSAESERGVRYNDPDIGILWPLEPCCVSIKDQNQPLLSSP